MFGLWLCLSVCLCVCVSVCLSLCLSVIIFSSHWYFPPYSSPSFSSSAVQMFFFSEYLPPLSCPFFSLVGWFKIAQFFLQITFDGSLSRVKARSQFVFNTLLVAFLWQPYKFETSRKAQTNPGNGCRKGCKSKEWYDLHVLLQLLHAVYSLDRRMITTLSAIWAMDDSRIANNNWFDCCLCQNITLSDDDVHSTIDIFVFVDLWKAFVCFGPSLVLLSWQISICERVSSTFVILPTISKMQNISFILFYVVSFFLLFLP